MSLPCFRPILCWLPPPLSGEPITFSDTKGEKNGFQKGFLPCGKCFGCRKNKAQEWMLRCQHEFRHFDCNSFVTLTYSSENLPYCSGRPCLFYRDVQLFLKRLRKAGYNFRYLVAGEYGTRRHRPHYHIVFFGLDLDSQILEDFWQLGIVDSRPIIEGDDAVAGYVAGYAAKKLTSDFKPPAGREPFLHASLGLGLKWFLQYGQQALSIGFIIQNGYRKPIPRYYLRKAREFFLPDLMEFLDNRDSYIVASRLSRVYSLPESKKRELELSEFSQFRKGLLKHVDFN